MHDAARLPRPRMTAAPRRNATSATIFRVVFVLVTLLAAWLTATRLHVSPDIAALFPNEGESRALARFTRAFGGGDLALVLVRGDDPSAVDRASTALADRLRGTPNVLAVVDRAPERRDLPPSLAWAWADGPARRRLADAVGPGMRARLEETRALLLAPGSADASAFLAKDPLRLAQIPWEGHSELAGSVSANAGDPFVADGGRARLVVVEARGRALESAASRRFVDDVSAVFAATAPSFPGVTFALTGGHAIACETESLLRTDLVASSIVSMVLASLAFVLTFRRVRALVAVLPPLLLGTLWTTGVAALLPTGLSAIAIAFASVVVGVGVDSGVHVYGALLEGRRNGLSPEEAATWARRTTRKPVLVAAVVAGSAFAALGLSQMHAVRQLGLLSGIGEILTAVAIVVLTPAIGARLERGPVPPPRPPRWTAPFVAIARSRRAAVVALALASLPFVAFAAIGTPKVADAIVAIRPTGIPSLVAQDEIQRLFGGTPGQWILLTTGTDDEQARTKSDALSEVLEVAARAGEVDGYDSLTTFAPSTTTMRRRLVERDALDLRSREHELETTLVDLGFDIGAFPDALRQFTDPDPLPLVSESKTSTLSWLEHRHLAHEGGESMIAIFVRPSGVAEKDARALARIRDASPSTIVTGYPYLERGLKKALAEDLPRVAFVAFLVAAVALRAALGSFRDVAIALATVVVELALVAAAMRAFHVHFHVYDALVLPVLVGITLDESMFLLHAVRTGERDGDRADGDSGSEDPVVQGLVHEAPLVVATALTTAAGFGALLVCRFRGLSDLGAVGMFGSTFGVLASLVVVPAALRLLRRDGSTDPPVTPGRG
ncbi:MAG: MMPL family transporter [Polyangiaceae bacterium]